MSIRQCGRFVAPVRRSDRDEDISIIIPTAGSGYRIKYYGPKALVKITESENLIQRQVRLLRDAYKKSDIVAAVGFQADKIIESIPSVRTVENERFDETSVTRSISLALRAIRTNKLLVVYGDLVFNEKTLQFNTSHSSVIVDKSGQIRDKEVGLTIQDGVVQHFGYSLPEKWCQILLLRGRELEIFSSLVHDRNNHKLLGHEILNELIDAGGILRAEAPAGMKIQEIDSSKDIESIQVK